ncbi:uncharacterized BrkB/YihY/UPF0761 family membrane protein [Cytobacillus purgationiresistens]|uniref:Uncharacterized BrkB/YihY/UPF0761 family membrane protein n=1 Tax=Cytobacillus purgationiresistens TaxID=863449 RepID=A0ABU0AN97_9BACI|nr:uncharacterized BrkB/YihY/UPF0761 family membrane protein [Cytobacillus purgationiresistens]
MIEDLNKLVEGSFNAISILLVFSTGLFSISYPPINDVLNKDIDREKPKALKRQRENLYNILFSKCIPILIISFIIVYISLPLGIRIASESTLDLIHFDFIRTAYMLIWFLNIGIFIISVYLLYRLIIKIKNCK